MAHTHVITDHDDHFIIDPITRKIKPETPVKNKLVRQDHKSERYTFEIPRYIEGHDVTEYDFVRIHYINISSDSMNQSANIYEVDDMGVLEDNPKTAVFSWLINRSATTYSGLLSFAIEFKCVSDGIITYVWHTEIYSAISVSDVIVNDDIPIDDEKYVDILEIWKNQLFNGNIGKKKRTFEKARIWYKSYSSGCPTIEADARVLAQNALVVGGGPLHDLENDFPSKAREMAVVLRAKELNPDMKFFWYIGIASYRGGDILGDNGVWDENSQDQPIMTNQQIIREIHRAFNVGGIYSGIDPETGLFKLTGGVKFDGIFWDEFDLDSEKGAYNQGYNDFTGERYWSDAEGKRKFLIEYARNLGLINFPNGWNSQGLQYMTPNDYFCLESNETRHPYKSENPNDVVYWMNAQTSNRLYSYYSSDAYKKYGCRPVPLSYIVDGNTPEEKERIMTWCVFNTLVQGGHYVAINGISQDWKIPELVDLFRIDEGEEYKLTKPREGVYSITVNGHTLTTYRTMKGSTLGGQTPANMSTLDKVYIEIDDVIFQNAYAYLPGHLYASNKKFDSIATRLTELDAALRSKEYASPYQKLMIDDWQSTVTFNDYTDLFEGTKSYGIMTNGYRYYTCEYSPEDDTVTFKYTSHGGNSGAGLSWNVSKLQPGHTYEIGCTEVTGAILGQIQTLVYVDGTTKYNNYSYRGKYEPSTFAEDKQRIYRFTVGEEPVDASLCFTTVNKNGGNGTTFCTISVKGVYCIDVNELDEDISKAWYTNMVDTVKGVVAYNDSGLYQYQNLVKNSDENSVNLEFTYHWLVNGGLRYSIPGIKAGHTYEIGWEQLTGSVISQIQILFYISGQRIVNQYQYRENTYKASELDPKRICFIRYTVPDSYSDNETFGFTLTTVSKNGGDGTTFYNIYLKGLYCYDMAETDELTIRGKTASKTTLAICRVTEEALANDDKLVRNALYLSDNGRAFVTNINGLRTPLVDAVYFGAVAAGYTGTPEEFGAKLAGLIETSESATET